MIDLTAAQQAIISAGAIERSWLWEVTPVSPINGTSTFYWSTKIKTFNGQAYTSTIIPSSFDGVVETRSRSEYGIQAPNEVRFDIGYDQQYASAFKDAVVVLKLVLLSSIPGEGGGETAAFLQEIFPDEAFPEEQWPLVGAGDTIDQEEVIRSYKFVVKDCFAEYGRLKFNCVDFVQRHLEGTYPNTPLIGELFPSSNAGNNDNMCVPVTFGTCYIPLRSVYAGSSRYYLLGPSDHTFTISAVRSPDDWAGVSEWDNTHTFTQSLQNDVDGNSWRVFQPIIADSDSDGVNDACGLWYNNGTFLDMPTQFSDAANASITNFADLIAYVLQDMGIDAADIDTGTGSTFATAAATFTSWGLTCNGAFYYKEDRRKVLSRILNMCHATLVIRDKIQLRVLSKTSRQTVTSSHILRKGDAPGPGTFATSPMAVSENDSGYVSFAPENKPQSKLQKAKVAISVSADNISSENLIVDFVQDSADVRKIGVLYYQRKLLKEANKSFSAKPSLLAIEPDDFLTVSGELYGGTYQVLVDEIRINPNTSMEFKCIKFSDTLYDWEDLPNTPLSIADEETLSSWTPVVAGPDSSNLSNRVPGRLWVGDSILLDSNRFEGAGAIQVGALLLHDEPFNIHDKLYWDHTLEALFARNLWVSGELHASVLAIDEVHASGGTQLLTGGSPLAVTVATPAALESDFTITVNDPPSGAVRIFAVGEFLQMKIGESGAVIQAWMQVQDYDLAGFTDGYLNNGDGTGSYRVRLKYGSTSTTFWEGTAVVNWGGSAARKMLLTSDMPYAPYLDIFTTGSTPWAGTTPTTRLGNLAGIYDAAFGGALTGEGLYSDNVYLKGMVQITGGSGAANLDDLGTAVADAIPDDVLQSGDSIANLEWDQTYLTGELVASPIISGNLGYFSGLFQVGSEGIIIDGANKLMRSANYDAGVDGFQIDSTGHVEMNDATVRGSIEIGAGSSGIANLSDAGALALLDEISTRNQIDNGDFAQWSSGASAVPDGWTFAGHTGGVVAREGTIKKIGAYSAKLTSTTVAGEYKYLHRDVHDSFGIAYWQGRTITVGAWLWCDTADAFRVCVQDGVSSDSTYHPGDSQWHWVTVTYTINAAASRVRPYALIESGDGVAQVGYVDCMILVEGRYCPAFDPKGISTAQGTGLVLDSYRMGYISAGVWQTYIQNNGSFRFGGDGDNYIAWNGANFTVALDGIFTIKGGGDLIVEGGTTPGEIIWQGDGHSVTSYINLGDGLDQFIIRPTATDHLAQMHLGTSTNMFYDLQMYAYNDVDIYARRTSTHYGLVDVSTTTISAGSRLYSRFGSNISTIYCTCTADYNRIYTEGFFLPYTPSATDIGTSSAPYRNVYANRFYYNTGFYLFDIIDDLQALKNIKEKKRYDGSSVLDPIQNIPIMETATFPEQVFAHYEEDIPAETYDAEDGSIIQLRPGKKKGAIIYGDDGEPFIDGSNLIAFLLGSAKKLVLYTEGLEDRIKELENIMLRDEGRINGEA